jgi:uncharacterized protein
MSDRVLNGHFFNPTKGNLSLEGVLDEMIGYMSLKPEGSYEIIVGCDSSSIDNPHFPIAVAILRTGEGGRFFLKTITYPESMSKKFSFWRNRITEEVILSCEMALAMRDSFKKKMESLKDNNFQYNFRYIHADIGENGKTKDMIKELTGMIIGNGFEPKIKPESYVASSLADKYS